MKNKLSQIRKGFILALFFCCHPLFSQESENLYASVEETDIVVLEPSYTSSKNTQFEQKYHYIVARAYFRLLAEAQRSERKLRMEFERLSAESKEIEQGRNQTDDNRLSLARKKYAAHSNMLSGLKSWNLFSENRTGDMFYFMTENEDRIFKMYRGKLSEDKMVNYLIYKLADLYHLQVEK